ncbi:hypothetical protein GGR56DRAFT_680554 [Xylariaceae sp. FL0804]|nr:hypothetical protein GGR56DRAFT_680554 [Xylariaceae sp. FL0804]
MPDRPSLIDLRSTSASSVPTVSSRPLRSPRLHVAGDVPPTLSPLDAFAARSRLLAKQLEEEKAKDGNRKSRLPPLTVESPVIAQGRSDYFRSMSSDSASDDHDQPQLSPQQHGVEVESPSQRPVSMYPRMSRIPPTPDEHDPMPVYPSPFREAAARGRQLGILDENSSSYGARREQSPADIESLAGSISERRSMEQDSILRDYSPFRGRFPASPEKLTRARSPERSGSGLVPPQSLFPKRSSSIMSAPPDSNFEENLSASFHSQPARKLSSASMGVARPIASPKGHNPRSPSMGSEASLPLPRAPFNFSRPISRAGTPTLDAPSRQASSDSHPSFVLADDTVHTPVSMHSDAFADAASEDTLRGAPSYIYSKYSLPRGKSLQRNSIIFRDPEPQSSFAWEQPMVPPSNVQTHPRTGQAPPSPPSRPSSSSSRHPDVPAPSDPYLARPSMERSKLSNEMTADRVPSPVPSRPSTSGSRPSEDVPRGRAPASPRRHHNRTRGQTPVSVSTSDSASTIRPPKSSHSHAPSSIEMSAEEHLNKGIKCHEDGSVKESTYHLRLAARGGEPTGMLLYALACRHGWGMRPNQKEGVEWLRKAADAVGAEIADDEGQIQGGKTVDFMNRKTRKAQFALSIYELGVSHMNGWGIEQDKALAVRCFEIAGNWGDVDALAEAGFCYAQGVGCKKDLRKSAKFYRMAEAKGMSMPGNSWIHKAKYADDAASIKSRARSKSRTRGIFHRRPKETAT